MNSIGDLIHDGEAEKCLAAYIKGDKSTPLEPEENADGTISLFGPHGQLFATCPDAAGAVFIIRCMRDSARLSSILKKDTILEE